MCKATRSPPARLLRICSGVCQFTRSQLQRATCQQHHRRLVVTRYANTWLRGPPNAILWRRPSARPECSLSVVLEVREAIAHALFTEKQLRHTTATVVDTLLWSLAPAHRESLLRKLIIQYTVAFSNVPGFNSLQHITN
jgi:hypothetical protein